MIQLADNISPAEIVGKTDLLAGQNWLYKRQLLVYANMMAEDEFPWEIAQAIEPMAIEVGVNGKVISLGHHRWVAANLAGVVIPYPFEIRYDYVNANLIVPFACRWEDVHWE